MSASSVSFQDLVFEIACFEPTVGTVVSYSSLISDVYLFFFEDLVLADRETKRLNMLAAWKCFVDNSTFTADDFSDYWDSSIEELGLADDRLIMIEETVRLGFTKEDIISYCYGSYLTDLTFTDQGSVNVSPALLNQWVIDNSDDFIDLFVPTPNKHMYKHSYASTRLVNPNFHLKNTSDDENYPYQSCEFAPPAPILSRSSGWGSHGWNGVYLLSFYIGPSGEYYGQVYYHFYATKSGKYIYMHCDQYYLSDNSLYCVESPKEIDLDSFSYYAFTYFGKGDTPKVFSYGDVSFYLSQSDMAFWGNGDGRSPGISISRYFSNAMRSSVLSDTTQYNLRNLRLDSDFIPWASGGGCDWGYLLSDEPFTLYCNQDPVDLTPIPDDYTITVTGGDDIYDYILIDPDTGDSSTIGDYIINNYSFTINNPSTDDPSGGGSSGGTVSGDVIVGGTVTVSGDINIKSDPIDINVNVNGGGSSGSSAEGVQFDEDVSLNNYYDWMNEQTTGFSGFMSEFLSWLPPPVITMLCAGFACVIIARFLGR